MTSASDRTGTRTDAASRPQSELAPLATGPVAVVAVALGALLTLLSGRYGFHRDELYFLAAGRRLAWGYVDQPPLTPLLARASTTLFGDTPMGLRVVATLACMGTVVVVAGLARELAAQRRGQLLAACCTAASSFVLVVGHMESTATFDLLIWLVVCWLVLRLLRTGDSRWLVPIGLAVGVGLLNKYLVGLLALGMLVAVAAVGPRRVLASWWLAVGLALALGVAAPNLIWQATHGWPELTVASGIDAEHGTEDRALFVPLQLVYLSPLFVPLWAAGLLRLWRDPAVRYARSFAVAYPLLAVAVLVGGGKAYYVLPLLLVALAAGCEPVARWAARRTARGRVLAAGLVVAAAVNFVIALPVLPADAVALPNALNKEQGEQVGWPALVRAVSDGWARIPAGQRARAVIFTANYGEAGAIARYGPELGLPVPYSGHMSYSAWGPPPDSANGPVLLVHTRGDHTIASRFTDCRPVAVIGDGQDPANEEQHALVELCAGTSEPWSVLWPSLRRY